MLNKPHYIKIFKNSENFYWVQVTRGNKLIFSLTSLGQPAIVTGNGGVLKECEAVEFSSLPKIAKKEIEKVYQLVSK